MAEELELDGITWMGGTVDDDDVLAEAPRQLRAILRQLNGFVMFGGALHVRGAVKHPSWHSLGAAWRGPGALHELYGAVRSDDVPFAQDCVGDQLLLRDGEVFRLFAETGNLESKGLGLVAFLNLACVRPREILGTEPLERFLRDRQAEQLEPGRTLFVYPPFCTSESRNGVSIRDVPAEEGLRAHADFARQVANVRDGGTIRIATPADHEAS